MSAKKLFYTILVMAFCISSANADAGIPMLAIAWPIQWLALLPVIMLETYFLKDVLYKDIHRPFWQVAKANVISTLFGVPVAWLAMLVLEIIFGGVHSLVGGNNVGSSNFIAIITLPFMAAWPSPNNSGQAWVVGASYAVLAIPFCWASMKIEYWYLAKDASENNLKELWQKTKHANIASYIILSVFVALLLLYEKN